MFHRNSVIAGLVVMVFCLSGSCVSLVAAQTGESMDLKPRILELMQQTKYTDALPLLEKVVTVEPDNAQMRFYLGFALIAQAGNTKNQEARKALRVRARSEFVRSKELEIKEPLVEALIAGIPLDGNDGRAYSENIAANSLMIEAEAFFGQGKLDEALSDYQKALVLDPRLYHAALFAGDVFVQKGDFVQGLAWYDRAIAIDPNIETAYRYSATPLMKQGNSEAARDRYIEAFITEPYNKFARAGLVQWAQVTHTALAHPAIEIPTNVSFDDKGNAKIELDANALLGGKDDGSLAWIAYGAARTTWKKEQFARRFPNEPAYRHSLAEEAEALRKVIAVANLKAETKPLSPSLRKLKKLDDEGLLEAYILLANADQGIANDYPAYLKANRDKLRRYVLEYVAAGGGN